MSYGAPFNTTSLHRRRGSQQELSRDAGHNYFPASSIRLSEYGLHAQEGGMQPLMAAGRHRTSMTALDIHAAYNSGVDVSTVMSVTPPSSVGMSPVSGLRRTQSILEMRCQQRSRLRAHTDANDEAETTGDPSRETVSPSYLARRRLSSDNSFLANPLRKPCDSLQSLNESVGDASVADLSGSKESNATGPTSSEISDAFSADTNEGTRQRSRNRSISMQRRPSSGRLRSAFACALSGESWIFKFEQPALVDYADFLCRLERDNVCLESIKYYPVYETFRGRVKVRNLCYRKEVIVRASYDCWRTHRDFRCQYDELSSQACDPRYDTFAFEIPVPSWQVGCFDFCVAFRSMDCGWWPTYWDNNEGNNYSAVYRSPDRGNIDAVIERYEASKQQQQQQQQFFPSQNVGLSGSSSMLRRSSRSNLTTNAWLPANSAAYYYDAAQPSLVHQPSSLPPLSFT